MGQVIGAVLADTPEIAKRAAALVVVGYEELPIVMTIEDAISAERCDRLKWCSIRDPCLGMLPQLCNDFYGIIEFGYDWAAYIPIPQFKCSEFFRLTQNSSRALMVPATLRYDHDY